MGPTVKAVACPRRVRLGDSVIGYYVHHQGRGHLQRARAIGRHLAEPPTMFSSIARPDQVDRWIALPMDNQSSPEDPTASGTLHWVPRHDRGLRRRMAIIAEWIDAAQPDLMVVDVSVEVAVLCRLMGVPTDRDGDAGGPFRPRPSIRLRLGARDSRAVAGRVLHISVVGSMVRQDFSRRRDLAVSPAGGRNR